MSGRLADGRDQLIDFYIVFTARDGYGTSPARGIGLAQFHFEYSECRVTSAVFGPAASWGAARK